MTDEEIKSEAAKMLGSLGGKARAKNLTPEQRQAIGRLGAKKRWGNTDEQHTEVRS